ncbi:MAG: hypothetical protein PHE54_02405 [Bacilli bacterium]|nr:hypothetical protein [Bacilli bacterium]
MKIILDNDNIEIFLNKYMDLFKDLDDKDNIEEYFRTLFVKLKKYYNIKMLGFYNITIYNNSNYGMVIKIENDNFDYCDYFGNQIDMKISIEKDSVFLYKIGDILCLEDNILSKVNIYNFRGNLYASIKETLTLKEMAYLIENSDIIYGEEAFEILENSKKMNISSYFIKT